MLSLPTRPPPDFGGNGNGITRSYFAFERFARDLRASVIQPSETSTQTVNLSWCDFPPG